MERQEGEIENQCSKTESTINKATEKTLKVKEQLRRKRSGSITYLCIKETEKKKQLRLRYLQTGREEDKRIYQEQRRQTKTLCRYEKRQLQKEKIQEIKEKRY